MEQPKLRILRSKLEEKNHEKNGAVKSLKLTDGSLTVYEALQSAVLPLEEGKGLVLNLLGSDSAFLVNIGILDFWHTDGCFSQKKFKYLSLLPSLVFSPNSSSSSSCVDHRDMLVLFSQALLCDAMCGLRYSA